VQHLRKLVIQGNSLKTQFSITIFTIVSFFGYTQNFSIPPPPDAASLGKYGDIPVSTYTGIPQISIPLYELKGRHLSLPISLSYHASGVKVEEISSWVGIGWSLNAGGVITRNINGLTDFKSKDGIDDNHGIATPIVFDNQGYQIKGRQIPMGITGDCKIQWEDGSINTNGLNNSGLISNILFENRHDTEPDIFYFNFGGYSGKFFFDKNRQIQCDNPEELKFLTFPTKDSDGWVIQTLDGTTYTFGTENYDEQGNETESWVEWTKTFSPPETNSNTQASSWFLKSITKAGEVIRFNYDRLNYKYSILSGSEQLEFELLCANSSSGETCQDPGSALKTATIFNIQGLFLKNIAIDRADGSSTRVEFLPEDDRIDLSFTDATTQETSFLRRRLGIMKILEPNRSGDLTQIRAFNFSHNILSNKLWLSSIQEVGYYDGIQENKPYLFSYYNHELFPLRTSTATDLWGFYNGRDQNPGYFPNIAYDRNGQYHISSTPGGDDKTSVEEKSKYGILTKIVYPTGGFTEFEYEANRLGSFNVYSNNAGIYTVCKAFNPEVPCIENALESIDFTVTIAGDYTVDTKVIHGTEKTSIAKLCKEYLVSGYATSCEGVSIYSKNFTVYGNEKHISLNYAIIGSSANNPANTIQIKQGSILKKEISIYGGYSAEGTILLDLEPGTYEVIVNAVNIANHKVYCELIRETYAPSIPTYKIQLDYPNGTNQSYVQTGLVTLHLIPGAYTLKAVQVERQVSGAKASCTLRPVTSQATSLNLGAGIRIKRIKSHDDIDERNNLVKRFEYVDENGNSSAGLTKLPITYFITSRNSLVAGEPSIGKCFYKTFSSSTAYPLSTSAAGSFVGYHTVITYEGENGENGKILRKYHHVADEFQNDEAISLYICPLVSVPDIVLRGTPSFTNYFENGKLKEEIIYINNNGLFEVKFRTQNAYSTTIKSTNGLRINSTPKPPRFHTLYDWRVVNPCEVVAYKYYTVRVGFKQLIQSIQTTYFGNGQELSTTTDYSYTSSGLLAWEKSIDHLGRDLYAVTHYLPERNLVREKVSNLYHHTNVPLSGIVNEYNGLFPIKVYLHEPVREGESPASEVENGVSNQHNYKKRKSYTYNNYWNVTSETVDGAVTSIIWSPNQLHVLAKAVNASPAQIFHTSFETIVQGNTISNSAKTGLMVRSETFSESLPNLPPGTYHLTYWKKDGMNWEYHAEQITTNETGYFLMISASDNSPIDEVRLYPIGSKMTSYAHEQGIGLLSLSDENCDTKYFEYDPLGRLINILDTNRNIVKSIKYNLKD
jgi:hypothetical protein